MALSRTGKVLYTATFLFLLPVALVCWATATANVIRLPIITSIPIGLPLAAIGMLLMLFGMRALWVHGGGLPMNAHPPPHYVNVGVYRLLPHPIYTGFSVICVGVSISVGSSSGLWLVSPVVIMGCAALVLGYEQRDLQRRFGDEVRQLLPPDGPSPASRSDRIACYVFAVLPWVAFHAATFVLRTARTSVQPSVSVRMNHSLAALSDWISATAYLALAMAPALARSKGQMRRFTLLSVVTTNTALLLALILPLFRQMPNILSPKGWATAPQQSPDYSNSFFPSLVIISALLATSLLNERWPFLRGVLGCWLVAVTLSCLVSPHDGLLGVSTGVFAVGLASRINTIWRFIQALSERVANSWKEWRIGPVRVISHGGYIGLAGFLALSIAGTVSGPGHETALIFAACLALLGAGLWAQIIEGSSQLLRPYGFYGGLLGGVLGALMAPLFHTPVWLLLAAFSAGGAWGQAVGRLRCLVQGCCHGCPTTGEVGIRYAHPMSRVCRFTSWTNVPLHPTPVYSLLWNSIVGVVMLRLWVHHAALHLITGVYFILTGLGRFVEEAWRGEPQTRVVSGLRLYQWAALTSVLVGALFTALGISGPAPNLAFGWAAVVAAGAFGLMIGGAMGVDFPDSNRRFSRLA
jgi:protein-S-isoprenylcysteine O-methyltransferase Ste14